MECSIYGGLRYRVYKNNFVGERRGGDQPRGGGRSFVCSRDLFVAECSELLSSVVDCIMYCKKKSFLI